MMHVITDSLAFILPLLIMAIGGIFSEKSGVTNLALEGLQGFGAFTGAVAAALCATHFAAGSTAPFYIALISAVIGGAVFSLLHAFLCIRFRADQVVSGVVINLFSLALTTCLTKSFNRILFHSTQNRIYLDVAPQLVKGLYTYELIIIALAGVCWFILYRTRFGLRLRACGDNPNAVDAAGLSVERIRYLAVIISGALSGLAGMCFAYSITGNFSSAVYMGYGYLSIAALIFGNWTILPTLKACLLFGFAKYFGYELVKHLNMPSSYSDLVMILPYAVTLILLIFYSGSTRAPRALGEAFDKGKR